MGTYQHDMSQENEKTLLPEGWHEFEIVKCEEQISKSGNEMFKFTMAECNTFQELEVFAIAVKKKRWFLKSILKACDIAASQDGVYDWSISDVLDKVVKGRIEHKEEEWTNRDNEKVITTKHKIVEIKSLFEEEKEKKVEDLLPRKAPF